VFLPVCTFGHVGPRAVRDRVVHLIQDPRPGNGEPARESRLVASHTRQEHEVLCKDVNNRARTNACDRPNNDSDDEEKGGTPAVWPGSAS
jgi:hypothetical protein